MTARRVEFARLYEDNTWDTIFLQVSEEEINVHDLDQRSQEYLASTAYLGVEQCPKKVVAVFAYNMNPEQPAAPLTLEERVTLAQEVYDTVIEATDDLHDDDIGADLAYLIGALLKDTCVDVVHENRHPLLAILRSVYPPRHVLWTKYIVIQYPEKAKEKKT